MTHAEVETAYRDYGHLVLRRCQRVLRGDAAAEDVLQEVFVRLWRYGDAFRAADSKLLWLYRVADRCCFDHLARRPNAPTGAPLDAAAAVAAPGAGHDGALADRDVVMRFLGRFDDRVKQVAVLHYLDEMTQDEIAAATGWSRQTVWKKITFLKERARGLRASLYGEGEGT
jgi:RNA polymerase sigma-70 factor (ECF subfamily)